MKRIRPKRMSLKLLSIFAVAGAIVLSLPVFGQPAKLPAATNLKSHGVTQKQLDSLSEIMRQAVEQEQIAGCSFLVVHKGEVVFRNAIGYADIASKRLFATGELLPIASVSKPFLASVLMVLVEQGKLKLDDSGREIPAGVRRDKSERRPVAGEADDHSPSACPHRRLFWETRASRLSSWI